jgi:hypothetical protein
MPAGLNPLPAVVVDGGDDGLHHCGCAHRGTSRLSLAECIQSRER